MAGKREDKMGSVTMVSVTLLLPHTRFVSNSCWHTLYMLRVRRGHTQSHNTPTLCTCAVEIEFAWGPWACQCCRPQMYIDTMSYMHSMPYMHDTHILWHICMIGRSKHIYTPCLLCLVLRWQMCMFDACKHVYTHFLCVRDKFIRIYTICICDWQIDR